jgi:L-threonylcarbamoyladenylate synthase
MTHDASIAGVIDDPRTLELAREWLEKGGVVVLPTDTLYGFSAKLSAEPAIRRISAIKRAPNERRYILLASSIDMVDRYVQSYGCLSRDALVPRWPAPLSVIVPSGPALPPWVGPTVAVRVPALEPLRRLIDEVGEPIVSTSVNRAGEEPLEDAHDIRR